VTIGVPRCLLSACRFVRSKLFWLRLASVTETGVQSCIVGTINKGVDDISNDYMEVSRWLKYYRLVLGAFRF
jgi:hypothetical protein